MQIIGGTGGRSGYAFGTAIVPNSLVVRPPWAHAAARAEEAWPAAGTQAERRVREIAARDRARAADDRGRAAEDRARAADDRRRARIDLRAAHIDDLTGVYTRGLGLLTLANEIERAHRSGEPFVLAFVDVDRLKQVNDSEGHAAGDALLRAIGATLRSKLRSYDPIVRVGGDEFVCALSNTNLKAARDRLHEIHAALERDEVGSISCGLAELRAGERLDDLTDRADDELQEAKRRPLRMVRKGA